MTFLEKLQVIERVDGLIRRKATGTAEELSSRLGVSRRTIYEIINVMKQMDAPIEYCKSSKTFYYAFKCDLAIRFVCSDKIKGGCSQISQDIFGSAVFLHNPTISL